MCHPPTTPILTERTVSFSSFILKFEFTFYSPLENILSKPYSKNQPPYSAYEFPEPIIIFPLLDTSHFFLLLNQFADLN